MDKKQTGKKFDTGKSPVRRGVLEYFPRAILEVGNLSGFGAEKYDWNNWEFVEDGINRYGDAQIRHICEAAISGEADKGSELLHATHSAWNALAVLELTLREKEKEAKHLSETEDHRTDSIKYAFVGIDPANIPAANTLKNIPKEIPEENPGSWVIMDR